MTIHKSKGLEYPIVYLPFLNSSFFFDENTDNFIYSSYYHFILPLTNEKESLLKHLHMIKEKEEALSEKIRLFYVALTRARDKLIVIRRNPTFENNLDDYIVSNATSINYLLNCIGGHLRPYTYDINIDELKINNEYKTLKSARQKLDSSSLSITHKINKNDSYEIERVHSSKEVKDLSHRPALWNRSKMASAPQSSQSGPMSVSRINLRLMDITESPSRFFIIHLIFTSTPSGEFLYQIRRMPP